MSKVSVQIAVLLLGGQIALGAIGLALSGSMPWLGLLLSILLFWLIVRTARVLRREMELAVARKAQVTPWVQALSVVLTWLWPAALLLPGWPFMPQWAPDLWNGSLQPVVGTVALWNSGVAAVMDQWLWLMVPVEGLLYLAVAGRP
ncbi:MAG TPA: hypothetical protein VD902_02470, partial [Symbiobacteriaceae bacterium]|nr:hypothetical protein [Symbiobacteriaceae bacterium]